MGAGLLSARRPTHTGLMQPAAPCAALTLSRILGVAGAREARVCFPHENDGTDGGLLVGTYFKRGYVESVKQQQVSSQETRGRGGVWLQGPTLSLWPQGKGGPTCRSPRSRDGAWSPEGGPAGSQGPEGGHACC